MQHYFFISKGKLFVKGKIGIFVKPQSNHPWKNYVLAIAKSISNVSDGLRWLKVIRNSKSITAFLPVLQLGWAYCALMGPTP